MQFFFQIYTVCRYEMKVLFRSWFFRIFAALSIFIIGLMNLIFLEHIGDSMWEFRAVNASIPYIAVQMLNVAQALIAIFLASDFLKRDKKDDTTEVIYIREMSNAEYVLGKTLGIVILFLLLNFTILAIVAIENLTQANVATNGLAYLLYPLFVSVPSLIFVIGLSFLLMTIIRNQAVTFVILLGYAALSLFYMGWKFHPLFDFFAFFLPMMYSDFVGFSNLTEILLHRGIYTSLGLSFILLIAVTLKRLSQSRRSQIVSSIFSFVFFIIALVLIFNYIMIGQHKKSIRKEYVALNNKYFQHPMVDIENYDIQLKHLENSIDVMVKMRIKNTTDIEIKELLFSLNPSLTISKVSIKNSDITFKRQLHLLFVPLSEALQAQQELDVEICYSGTIDENVCYTDISDEKLNEIVMLPMMVLPRRYAYITDNYVLLTPESNWYPVAGVTYSSDNPVSVNKNFARFMLNVETKKGLVAVSQGVCTNKGTQFSFVPNVPLPSISLSIGNYESHSITVDSISYSAYILKNHDYYKKFFSDITDTIPALLKDFKVELDKTMNMPYPFQQITMVEVPVSFHSFKHLWTSATETVQPEIVLMHEKGIFFEIGNLYQKKNNIEEGNKEKNEEQLPKQVMVRIFNNFLRQVFIDKAESRRFRNNGITYCYSLYPNYFAHTNNISSVEFPLINIALETYFSPDVETNLWIRNFFGLSNSEKANLSLQEKSLKELIKIQDDELMLNDAIKLKGDFLLNILKTKTKGESFDVFLRNFVVENRYQSTKFDTLSGALEKQFKLNMGNIMSNWYSNKELPAFMISNAEYYKVQINDREKYQIEFTVENLKNVDGIIEISLRVGGEEARNFDYWDSNDEQVQEPLKFTYLVEAHQRKQIGVVVDEQVREMQVNTYISQNLPMLVVYNFDKTELRKNATAFEGERILDSVVQVIDNNEIIVDNEDKNFQTFSSVNRTFLREWVNGEEAEQKYQGLNMWNPPQNWTLNTSSEYYGSYIRSAHYIRSGSGDAYARWSTLIPQSGYYEVYLYVVQKTENFGRHRTNEQQKGGTYKLRVYHADGVEDAEIELKDIETGWYLVGSYYLDADSTKVELTNKAQNRVVVADAVKWVRRK